ncbi:MAG TPA: LamG domain-containing protein, partial [Planctomycetota bacterium]|nr:LamG domain-containing protein [Planctomycetota bacterium]
AYAIVTAHRTAPPRDAEVRELELGRAGAPAFDPLSADDLVGYWKFDENSGGSVADGSGRGHGGQFRGDAKWGAGKTGSGLVLAANDGFVEVGDAPDLCPAAITMAAWVNLPSMPTKAGNIVSKGQNGGYRFRVSNNGEVEVFDRGTENGLRTVEKVPLGQWVHLAVTGDATGLKIYVNGRLSVSNTVPYGAPKVSHSLKIGAETDFQEFFGGSIDEVCLYKRSLTPSEVQHLYRLGPK